MPFFLEAPLEQARHPEVVLNHQYSHRPRLGGPDVKTMRIQRRAFDVNVHTELSRSIHEQKRRVKSALRLGDTAKGTHRCTTRNRTGRPAGAGSATRPAPTRQRCRARRSRRERKVSSRYDAGPTGRLPPWSWARAPQRWPWPGRSRCTPHRRHRPRRWRRAPTRRHRSPPALLRRAARRRWWRPAHRGLRRRRTVRLELLRRSRSPPSHGRSRVANRDDGRL